MNLDVDIFDLKKMKKKLEGFEGMESGEVLRLLTALGGYRIDKELLSQSNIHVLLGKITKDKTGKLDPQVVRKAQEIRNNWKLILIHPQAEIQKKVTNGNISNDEELFDLKPQNAQKPLSENKSKGSANFIPIQFEDKNRERIFGLLREKFKAQFNSEEEVNGLAKEVEDAIFNAASSLKVDYVKHGRERLLILSDKAHQKEIIEGLIKGLIAFSDFAEKEPRELLNKHRLDEIEAKNKEWAMKAMQSDFYMRNTETKDSEFQCPKCKHRKIYSTQKQTRSADEPMTTFFKCLNCDYNWKMY